jgi:SRSO17 transposase
MNTHTLRLPHAASEPLPELAAFLEPFHPHFARSAGRHLLERYLTGLLSEHPNKNCDTLAQVIPGASEQAFQNLLTTMVWDDEAVNWERVQRMRRLETEGDGVLILDDTGFPKKGTASVGVARQYSGTTGTVDNCQVAVTCVYAERTIAWPVNTRVYLPQEWADDPQRRERAHVPADIRFQTKPEIALDLVDQARDMGVPFTCVVVDSGYGDVPSFLDGLEQREESYVAGIHCTFRVG